MTVTRSVPSPSSTLLLLFVLLAALFFLGCGKEVTTPDEREGYTSLHLFADLAGTPAVRLNVTVTASDIPVPMEFSIPAERSIAQGAISLPVGNDRLIQVAAADVAGAETHTGSVEIDILEGSNPTHDFSLAPANPTGRLIPVRLGILVITIDPEVSELEVGETVQLDASIKEVGGRVVNGSPKWSTTNRGIASIDTRGLVTAHSPGMVTVAAEFQFTIGLARIFVAGEDAEFFVSASTGDDANPGTRNAPFATIQKGIDAAAATGEGGDVIVAGGSYSESLTLRSRVDIHGGFDPETWLRDIAVYPSSVFGGRVAVSGTAIHSVTVDGLSIWSSDGLPQPEVSLPESDFTDRMSSIGVRLIDCRDVVVSHNVIGSGRGAYGHTSSNQPPGINGSPGETGYEGGVRITIPPGGPGGLGGEGSSSGFRAGTDGGAGGVGQVALLFEESGDVFRSDFAPAGSGEDGEGIGGGAGGNRGTGITSDVWEQAADTFFEGIKSFFCFLVFECDSLPDPSLDWGGDGQDGTPGQPGTPGANGTGGGAFGVLVAGTYVPASGLSGEAGQSGFGGGGGGGGGSHLALGGGSGGGGGGGGEGGRGGIPGFGAGGSFTVLLANSTGIEILGNTIHTGAGGRGGDGGAGGAGGLGGQGAIGGPGGKEDELDFGVFSIPTGLAKAGGTGGKGGDGGAGGAGGAGGGGGGGPTIGIVEDRDSQSMRSGNSFALGAAGEGGVSRGIVATKEGNRGADGIRAEFAKFAGVGAEALFLELELPSARDIPVLIGSAETPGDRR